jgi:hypothetical protein
MTVISRQMSHAVTERLKQERRERESQAAKTLGDVGKCRCLCLGPCEWQIRSLDSAYSRRLPSGYYMCPECGQQLLIVNPTIKLSDVDPDEMRRAKT